MNARPRNAERTRAAILEAARRLFAERGIGEVSIRTIADAAGVSHGLVQQYFGTREQMVAGIIKREIDAVMAEHQPISGGSADVDLEFMRRDLQAGADRFRDFALLVMRAELAGIEPEKMLDPGVTTPAMRLASAIAGRQARRRTRIRPAMDPALVSAYVNAAIFGFGTMAPWLMASVGLKPRDYRRRFDEIVGITMNLLALATGAPPPGPAGTASGAEDGTGSPPSRRRKAARPGPGQTESSPAASGRRSTPPRLGAPDRRRR